MAKLSKKTKLKIKPVKRPKKKTVHSLNSNLVE